MSNEKLCKEGIIMVHWTLDLCEYYNVTPEEADLLGQRSDGRKPDLPGSPTCEPVSGKTWEDLWEQNPRETQEQIFSFYKEIGSWSSFRQVNFRKNHEFNWISQIIEKARLEPDFKGQIKLLEYGCGVAPVIISLVDSMPSMKSICNFYISDVPSEHFEFAKWRMKKRGINFEAIPILPNSLPDFGDNKFDITVYLECFEHIPNPLQTIEHMIKHVKDRSVFMETWIDHKEEDHGYSDLKEAVEQREESFRLIKNNYELLAEAPFEIRAWLKKKPIEINKVVFDERWQV